MGVIRKSGDAPANLSARRIDVRDGLSSGSSPTRSGECSLPRAMVCRVRELARQVGVGSGRPTIDPRSAEEKVRVERARFRSPNLFTYGFQSQQDIFPYLKTACVLISQRLETMSAKMFVSSYASLPNIVMSRPRRAALGRVVAMTRVDPSVVRRRCVTRVSLRMNQPRNARSADCSPGATRVARPFRVSFLWFPSAPP